MSLRNDRELANTKQKLRLLEQCYQEAQGDLEGSEQARDAERRSLKRRINQFKEEIACYEARQPARR